MKKVLPIILLCLVSMISNASSRKDFGSGCIGDGYIAFKPYWSGFKIVYLYSDEIEIHKLPMRTYQPTSRIICEKNLIRVQARKNNKELILSISVKQDSPPAIENEVTTSKDIAMAIDFSVMKQETPVKFTYNTNEYELTQNIYYQNCGAVVENYLVNKNKNINLLFSKYEQETDCL